MAVPQSVSQIVIRFASAAVPAAYAVPGAAAAPAIPVANSERATTARVSAPEASQALPPASAHASTRVATRASAVLSLLQQRRLDRTLTSVKPATAPSYADWQIPWLDAGVGGVPRGQVSEVVGPVSSGRTGLAWAALAAATARGERVALIDTFDRFDPVLADEAGVDLSRVLWVRGQPVSRLAGALDPDWVPGQRAAQGPGTLFERSLDRALTSVQLAAQSGVCTLVVLDLLDVPALALRRIPRSTWLRLQHSIEGSPVAVLLLGVQPMGHSAGGLSIAVGPPVGAHASDDGSDDRAGAGRLATSAASASARVQWRGTHDRARRLHGLQVALRGRTTRKTTMVSSVLFG